MEALRSVTQSQGGVKQQLQSFIQFLVSSLATIHGLFVGKSIFIDFPTTRRLSQFSLFNPFTEGFPDSNLPQGLLSEKLKSACLSNAEPTIQLLGLSPGFIRQLPPIITEFRYS
jgi:hypothetical protein